jgi:hypothetical protein
MLSPEFQFSQYYQATANTVQNQLDSLTAFTRQGSLVRTQHRLPFQIKDLRTSVSPSFLPKMASAAKLQQFN